MRGIFDALLSSNRNGDPCHIAVRNDIHPFVTVNDEAGACPLRRDLKGFIDNDQGTIIEENLKRLKRRLIHQFD